MKHYLHLLVSPRLLDKQANTLARHLVLQKYQQSVIVGGGLPWATPPGGDANYDELETPVVLSARLEAVKILLDAVSSREGGGGGDSGERAVVVGDADDRERECWLLLLEAREAYVEWTAVCRARERGGRGEGDEDEEAVQNAAEIAMEAMEGVLTFEVGLVGG